MLSIGRRKAGTEIQCPKCGRSQLVPSLEEAAAALAAEAAPRSPPAEPVPSGIFIFDEEPEEESRDVGSASWGAFFGSPSEAASAPSPSSESFAGPVSQDASFHGPSNSIIWISRRTLYLQALLILLVGVIGFALGYWLGWADSPSPPAEPGQQPSGPVVVEGRLLYRPEPLRVAPDEDAVAIFLPADRTPEERFGTFGLRPQDSGVDPAGHPMAQAIVKFGGAYVRTDAEGNFLVQLPKEGSYYILFISRHARRADPSIPEPILQEMKNYFPDPRNLIAQSKFHWTRQNIRFPAPPMEYDFDR